MNVLLTGCAGFIGSHTLEKLLLEGHNVLGVDNFDPYYSRAIKQRNIVDVVSENFSFIEGDLSELDTFNKIQFISADQPFDAIIHLAAKAGVRASIEDPLGYQRANVIATQNILEFAKLHSIQQFVFASSSSVYGVNPNVPWREDDMVLKPISPYASTKVSCELMGHVYSKLFGIRFLGLRFFTVYGPRQRPDLAINKFMSLIERGKPIPVYGDGTSRRDYTYIDDIVSGIIGALYYTKSNFEIFKLGNDQTVTLSEMINTIESVLGQKAVIDQKPSQQGDVPQTWANIEKARNCLNFNPVINFNSGIQLYNDWRKEIG